MEFLHTKAVTTPVASYMGDAIFREQGQARPVHRGTLLYAPGEPATHLYLVESGEIKLSRYTPDGRELTLDHLGPGSVFGETEILLDVPRECQAVARGEVTLWTLPREVMLESMERDPRFGFWLSHLMGTRQARMESRLEQLLFKSANGKVAQVLVSLAEDYGRETPEGLLIDYPITHQEIGNLIATTRETVSYAFMEFRNLGIISTRQRRTVVHDLCQLRLMAVE